MKIFKKGNILTGEFGKYVMMAISAAAILLLIAWLVIPNLTSSSEAIDLAFG